MFTHLFTVTQANKRLPLVKKIVQYILERGQKLKAILAAVNSNQDISQEALVLQEEIEDLMAELEKLGCFFRDWNFEIGLVDFPAMINGQNVMLCWRSDEAKLRWYHSLEEGYASRRLIPENLLEEEGDTDF